MKRLTCLTVLLAAGLAAGPALAQDACRTARRHVSDCALNLCPLLESPNRCASDLQDVLSTLAGEGCTEEAAAAVMTMTCQLLTDFRLSGSSNICIAAIEHQNACLDAHCQVNESPICEAFAGMGDEMMRMAEEECDDEAADYLEELLEMSCDEVLAQFGL